MKGFPAKHQLKLKITPVSSVDYLSCDTLPPFSCHALMTAIELLLLQGVPLYSQQL